MNRCWPVVSGCSTPYRRAMGIDRSYLTAICLAGGLTLFVGAAPAPAVLAADTTSVLLGGSELWPRLEADIAGARERVLIEAMSFEGDSAGFRLTEALLRSPARDRRVLVDGYTELCLSDRFVYSPRFWLSARLQAERRRTHAMFSRLCAGGVEVRITNDPRGDPLGLLRRNHKKLIVVDSLSYVGGINFSDHNFKWHDAMLRFTEGALAAGLAADFDSTWIGRNDDHPIRCGATTVYPLDGERNVELLQPLFELLAGARDSIWIESAYLTFPFYEALRAARARGVHVTHVAPRANNKGVFNSYAVWEASRSGIDLRHLSSMTHMKTIVVDGKTVVGGSINYDCLSTLTQQEYLLISHDPAMVRQVLERVVRPDNAASQPYLGSPRTLRGRWASWQLHLVRRLAARLVSQRSSGGD